VIPIPFADRCAGALVGLACGDAVGTTVEFRARGTFESLCDMVGGGPFGLAPGEWTEDTSMALCLADSLIARSGFDAADQMARYVNWWRWDRRPIRTGTRCCPRVRARRGAGLGCCLARNGLDRIFAPPSRPAYAGAVRGRAMLRSPANPRAC
jgi:hypothetical protein